MKVLLIEDMDEPRSYVAKLVKRRTGIVPEAPETWQEFLGIAKGKNKFDVVLLDGCLKYWQTGLNFKHASGFVLEVLQRPGTVIGISSDKNYLQAMELEFAAIVPADRKASFRFMKGGKDLVALFSALDCAMYSLHSAK